MEKSEIINQIKKVIEKQIEIKIKNSDENIDIDSFTMMLVITFADKELKVKLDMENLDFDKLKSLNIIAETIMQSKRA